MTVQELVQQAIDQIETEHPNLVGPVIARLRSVLRILDGPDRSLQGQINFDRQMRGVANRIEAGQAARVDLPQ